MRTPRTTTPAALSRIPPHNLEAETSVLGSILIHPDSIDEVTGLVVADDFYKPSHSKIYEAMCSLVDRREPIDIVVLTERLRQTGDLEHVGGATYLSWLADTVPSAANVAVYAKMVREQSLLRKTIRTLSDYTVRAFAGVEDVAAFLDEVERGVLETTSPRAGVGEVDMTSLMRRVLAVAEDARENPGRPPGIRTGLTKVDSLLVAALTPGKLVTIGARPAMGKSALAGNIVVNAATDGVPVALFSLEMIREELGIRMISERIGVSGRAILRGETSDQNMTDMVREACDLARLPIAIDDTPALSFRDIASRCRRYSRKIGDLGLVVVDYLQLMHGSERTRMRDGREAEVSEISQALKQLAKDLRCPVLALSQLNRRLESRPDKRPMLSDLRESGAVEQDSDVVVFIYRDEVYNQMSLDKGVAEIIVAKQRGGPTGMVKVGFRDTTTSFHDLEIEFARPPTGYDSPFYSD